MTTSLDQIREADQNDRRLARTHYWDLVDAVARNQADEAAAPAILAAASKTIADLESDVALLKQRYELAGIQIDVDQAKEAMREAARQEACVREERDASIAAAKHRVELAIDVTRKARAEVERAMQGAKSLAELDAQIRARRAK